MTHPLDDLYRALFGAKTGGREVIIVDLSGREPHPITKHPVYKDAMQALLGFNELAGGFQAMHLVISRSGRPQATEALRNWFNDIGAPIDECNLMLEKAAGQSDSEFLDAANRLCETTVEINRKASEVLKEIHRRNNEALKQVEILDLLTKH